MYNLRKPIVLIATFLLACTVSSCTLLAPEEEKRVRNALDKAGIDFERLHRSAEGERYEYRITLKADESLPEAALTALQAFTPQSAQSSLEVTSMDNKAAFTFYGDGKDDLAEAQALQNLVQENSASISRIHYREPLEESEAGTKNRLAIEFNGYSSPEKIKEQISAASKLIGGTVLYFNGNKVRIIGKPASGDVEMLALSLNQIHKLIERASTATDEYDYSITASIKQKEISIYHSLSRKAVINQEEISKVSLPEGWKIAF